MAAYYGPFQVQCSSVLLNLFPLYTVPWQWITRDFPNACSVELFGVRYHLGVLDTHQLWNSQKMYAAPSYNKIPQAAQPQPAQRRHPLANAVHVNHQETPPKPPPKAPSSPALPRQNPKVTPPSPPNVITDKSGKLQYHRVGFLGEVCSSVGKKALLFLMKFYSGRLCTSLWSERCSRQSLSV